MDAELQSCFQPENEVITMPAQIEIINMLSDAVKISKIGLLSPSVDYAMSFAGGKETKRYLDGSGMYTMTVQISGKGQNQEDVAETLCSVCDTLTHKNPRTFSKTDEWEIRRITVGTPPAPKGMDADKTWYYACVLSVNYYYKPRKD